MTKISSATSNYIPIDNYGYKTGTLVQVKYEEEVIAGFKKGKTPRGYCREIGFINVEVFNNEIPFVTEVHIYRLQHRGKGLGKKMYEYVINDLEELTTCFDDASNSAQNVWKSLKKKYKYTHNRLRFKNKEYLTVLNKKKAT